MQVIEAVNIGMTETVNAVLVGGERVSLTAGTVVSVSSESQLVFHCEAAKVDGEIELTSLDHAMTQRVKDFIGMD